MTTALQKTFDTGTFRLVPMEEIYHDEDFNCRGKIVPIDVVELANSIEEIGLIEPIILRPYDKGPKGTKYQIVAGYRRHKAHLLKNKSHIKAIIVEGLTDVEAKIINLSENLNRADLTIMQQARAVAELLMKGMTQKEIGRRLNRSTSWVATHVRVLELPKEIREDIEAGWLNYENIKDIAQMNRQQQIEAVKLIKDRRLTEGEKVRIRVTKATLKKDPKAKIRRTSQQIQKMIEFMLKTCGANIGTRALAWADATISTEDLYEDIERLCENEGINFLPPRVDITLE